MTNKESQPISDGELVRRAQAGELNAFEMLTGRYEERVYSLALRMLHHQADVEEVTQQTFLSALQNLAGFRDGVSFSAWLLNIATHATIKMIRKRKGLVNRSSEANNRGD